MNLPDKKASPVPEVPKARLFGASLCSRFSSSFTRNLPLAIWIIYPSFPIRWFRPSLHNVEKLTVDRLCDLCIDGVYPFDIARNNLSRWLPRPFYLLSLNLIPTLKILRNIEMNCDGNAATKVALKCENIVHVESATIFSANVRDHRQPPASGAGDAGTHAIQGEESR